MHQKLCTSWSKAKILKKRQSCENACCTFLWVYIVSSVSIASCRVISLVAIFEFVSIMTYVSFPLTSWISQRKGFLERYMFETLTSQNTFGIFPSLHSALCYGISAWGVMLLMRSRGNLWKAGGLAFPPLHWTSCGLTVRLNARNRELLLLTSKLVLEPLREI